MNRTVLVSAVTAIITGIAIAIQSALNSRVGIQLGAARTGVLANLAGGSVAAIILVVTLVRSGPALWRVSGAQVGMLAVVGVLGVAIVAGVAFSVTRVGLAAGLGAIIMGQMLAGIVLDAAGLSGSTVEVDLRRVVGLALLSVSIYLLLPRR